MEKIAPYAAGARDQLSHDLRIPLSSIMGAVDLLRCGTLSLEQERYVVLIEMAAKRLLGLEEQLHRFMEVQ